MRTTHAVTFSSPVRRVALAALGSAALAAAAASSAHAAPNPSQPPELQALEQRMSELTVNSQRISGSVAFSGKLPRKAAALRSLQISFSGEQSLSPPASTVTTTIAGKALTVTQIGDVLYLKEPSLASHDGGRPWVKLDAAERSKLFGANPGLGQETGLSGAGTGLSGASSGGSAQAFTSEAELLEKTPSVRALGASTVDGQAVSGFAGMLEPKRAAAGQLPKKLLAELRRKHVKLTASYEMFVSAQGVPVETKLVIGLGKLKLDATADVLAINFPVSPVAPPAAGETISGVELERLARKRKSHRKPS
jgi:hypothetical protein